VIHPVILYGGKTWFLRKLVEKKMSILEREMFGPVKCNIARKQRQWKKSGARVKT